jgi:hypothetical protein
MLRGIGNIGSPWVGAGVCLQVVAERAASKHFGGFRNLGKSGPCADHTGRRTVDDTAVPEFGEDQGAPGFGRQSSREMNAGRWTGLQRRVRVPSPDEKQGARADGGDDTRAEGGRDLQVARWGLGPRPLIRPASMCSVRLCAAGPAPATSPLLSTRSTDGAFA